MNLLSSVATLSGRRSAATRSTNQEARLGNSNSQHENMHVIIIFIYNLKGLHAIHICRVLRLMRAKKGLLMSAERYQTFGTLTTSL